MPAAGEIINLTPLGVPMTANGRTLPVFVGQPVTFYVSIAGSGSVGATVDFLLCGANVYDQTLEQTIMPASVAGPMVLSGAAPQKQFSARVGAPGFYLAVVSNLTGTNAAVTITARY